MSTVVGTRRHSVKFCFHKVGTDDFRNAFSPSLTSLLQCYLLHDNRSITNITLDYRYLFTFPHNYKNTFIVIKIIWLCTCLP